jgi:putative ABC transport system permease protein
MLALRNVVRQRTRTALTLMAIAVGVASLVLIGGYIEDILVQLRETTIHSRLGHIQIYRTGQSTSGGPWPLDHLIDDAPSVEKAVAEVTGIAARARRLSFSGLLSNGRGELPILGEGIQPEPESHLGSALTFLAGRGLAATDRFGIVVGEGLASALKLNVGDSVNLVVSTRDGAMNALEFSVLGVFRSLSKEYDARAVAIPLQDAAELVDTAGISALVVLLEDTAQTEQALTALTNKLSGSLYEIKTWRELADFYNAAAALYERQFGVLHVIILVMVLLSVANTVNMTLHERTGEFGVMRALGQRGSDIFRLVVVECAILAVAGAGIGVVLGAASAVAISGIGISMPPPPNSESGYIAAIRLVPSVIVSAFVVGVIGAVVAALLPARKAAQTPVAEALRQAI